MSDEAASYAFERMFIYNVSILPTKTLTVSPELILSREADQKCYLQPAGTIGSAGGNSPVGGSAPENECGGSTVWRR